MESYANFKSVTVTVQSEPDLYVFGDVKTETYFINLIKTVLKPCPQKTRIEVSVQNRKR